MEPIDNEPISPLLQNMEAVEADDLLDEANQKAQAEAVHARISDAKELKEGLELEMPKLALLSFPRQVLALKKLRVLNVRANNLAMIPTELCETLRELEFLNIASNRLSYLPENISSLTRLRTLLMQRNEICELPEGIGRLPLLTELRLDHNRLKHLPETMGKLTSVKVLTVSGNFLQEVPASMAGMKALESLDLSENPDIEFDDVPEDLARLHEMYQLLHSKSARRKVITRALTLRPKVRKAVQEDVFANEPPQSAAEDSS
mmetsp:Transcript_3858/g.9122  ORF Transcript_3858/g.9122 Transcript_3858/m.9122 type:complete len:262 (+) Transcript_3858:123-908(+)